MLVTTRAMQPTSQRFRQAGDRHHRRAPAGRRGGPRVFRRAENPAIDPGLRRALTSPVVGGPPTSISLENGVTLGRLNDLVGRTLT